MKRLIFILLPLSLLLVLFLSYNLYFWNKIYPGISVNHLALAGKTVEEAQSLLAQNTTSPDKITVTSLNQNFDIDLKTIDFSYDFSDSAVRAYNIYRTGNIFADFYARTIALFTRKGLGLALTLNEDKLANNLSVISGQVSEEPVSSGVMLTNGTIVVNKGKLGKDINLLELRALIGKSLAFNSNTPINLPFTATGQVLTDSQAAELKTKAEKLLGKTLTLKSASSDIVLEFSDLINSENLVTVITSVAKTINREPQDSVFTFTNNQVSEFKPSIDGLTVKQEDLQKLLVDNINALENSDAKNINIDVPVANTPAKIQTKDANNLGIKELIGQGNSKFAHSIPNRIYNVELAASKFKGILVAPGDTFSFNSALGDVSALTGYKQAYIIQDGRTVLGDGGGVCQVSTTLFRAALNAGLPIVERIAHAYRVGYYEEDSPPGLDATVFDPVADLKIKNNTPAYILIQSTINPANLSMSFEIYGTADGRKATLTKPVVSDQVAPPPDLYQDDPTLPTGQIKQVDFSAWGAKVVFNYTVTKDGQTLINQNFVSNYHPWQAIYLRGTGI
jgi:vancomycin resistance protein YoaR